MPGFWSCLEETGESIMEQEATWAKFHREQLLSPRSVQTSWMGMKPMPMMWPCDPLCCRFTHICLPPSPFRSQPVGWVQAGSMTKWALRWAAPQVRRSLCPRGTVCDWLSRCRPPLRTGQLDVTRASWSSTKPWVSVPPGVYSLPITLLSWRYKQKLEWLLTLGAQEYLGPHLPCPLQDPADELPVKGQPMLSSCFHDYLLAQNLQIILLLFFQEKPKVTNCFSIGNSEFFGR